MVEIRLANCLEEAMKLWNLIIFYLLSFSIKVEKNKLKLKLREYVAKRNGGKKFDEFNFFNKIEIAVKLSFLLVRVIITTGAKISTKGFGLMNELTI